jgi:hypothetical protein
VERTSANGPPADAAHAPSSSERRRPQQVSPGNSRRTVPTVIIDTPKRYTPIVPKTRRTEDSANSQFEAIRPDAIDPPAGSQAPAGMLTAPPTDGDDELFGIDAVRCPSCGRPSPAGRRFCRCGATIAPTEPDPADDDPGARVPWHRRLRDGFGAGQSFWRAMRAANDGVRAKYDQAQSVQNRIMQFVAALGVVGISAASLGSWGTELRDSLWEKAAGYLPLSYSSVQLVGAVADPAGDPLPGFEPTNAIDLDLGRSWATGWATPQKGGTACGRQPGANRLVVSFSAPTQVDRVSLAPGLPAVSFARNQQYRPKVVDVQLSNGTCAELVLGDKPDLQSVPIAGKDITGLTLSIVDVYPAEQPADGSLVAITEVVVEHR